MPLKHFLFLNYCHAPRVENVKARVIVKEQAVQAEKQKRREEVLIQVKKRKAVEKTVDDLYEWVDELQAELVDAKVATKLAKGAAKSTQTKLDKEKTVASNRLNLLKSLKVRLDEAKDDLVHESKSRYALERMRTIQIEIKKERPIGRRGGAKQWPVHIVLLICELLVNGTNPSAVPANIQSTCAAFTGVEAEELPSVNFVRECRVVLQNLNETLSAFRLGTDESWHQAFTDGTTRRQIAFQNLVIALMEDGDLDPVIVSSCMFVENETAERCVKSIIETVSH